MIYKVSEVVKELGVSRQTVYKKLRREAYKPYIVEVDGVTGVTDGVSKLQEQLIDRLHKQLEVKDKQLEENIQINSLLKITENGQILQKMILSNTEIKLLAYRSELEERRKEHEQDKERSSKNTK